MTSRPLILGVSQCLLGDAVRYDGTGAKEQWPFDECAELFTPRGICPEVGIGMSVPRDPIRLVGIAPSHRVVEVADSTIDRTSALQDFALAQLASISDLCGYVFMQNSPSCGLFRVKVYPPDGGPPLREGTGVYAAAVILALPALPVEEASRLFDSDVRMNFIERCFVYARWLALAKPITEVELLQFHRQHKYLFMAHSLAGCYEAGQLILDKQGDVAERAQTYIERLMLGLRLPATRKGHIHVLRLLRDRLRRELHTGQLDPLDRSIEGYRRAESPLGESLALQRSHFEPYTEDYSCHRSYLELGLHRHCA